MPQSSPELIDSSYYGVKNIAAVYGRMYGFICHVFEIYLERRFGEVVKEQVRQKADICNDTTFYKFQVVDDDLVVKLLQTAQEVTGVPLDEMLEGIGHVFYETCDKTGHSELMNTLAVDLKTFLRSLDSLHAYLTVSFSEMNAPSFHCESKEDGSILLHYYSKRKGLEYLVIGIVKAVAKGIYHSNVDLEVLSRQDGQWGRNTYHVSFAVKGAKSDIRPIRAIKGSTKWPYCSREVFNALAPYNIMFNCDMILANVGDDITRLLPEIKLGSTVTDSFTLIKPKLDFTFDNLIFNQNTFLTFCPRKQTNILLQGPVKLLKNNTIAVLMATKTERTRDQSGGDIVGMRSQMQEERESMIQLEQAGIKLKKSELQLKSEMQKVDNLIYGMIPDFALEQVRKGHSAIQVPGDKTILASDIKGFTSLCYHCTPEAVVKMLNGLYALYDHLIEKYQLYKIEVIGDAYVVAGGLKNTGMDPVTAIVNFAFDMREKTTEILSPAEADASPEIRIGIHTGKVVAAVTGRKMKHYCLFGETLDIAKKMESSGEPGRIHISETTYEYLKKEKRRYFFFKDPCPKNYVTTYFVEPIRDQHHSAICVLL
ncbi:soluble guanylate cyclase gcy-35-like [Dysidea avara]|uniref:soluble guanylate cyclase gcy-35-like n=1 Tax=Dysidea avara TaxID=196820 RepID=UPI003330B1FF